MTQNRRIVLNILATYGRSLFALVCGIFTGRWVLMSLGQVDYGLYGLVGGLTMFISFFNSLLAGAIARFYAYSVGAASIGDCVEGLENCRKWFNTAICIHTIIPLLLIIIGYPIGCYAIKRWLIIPEDRVLSCIWVFRFVCVSCFIGMVNVPFQAMYTAKQYIAELTIYSIAQTSVNVCFLYYMVTHPQDWLVKYAAWACCVVSIPQVIICFRAIRVFPECQLRFRYLLNIERLRQLGMYAFWQFFACAGTLLRNQGVSILANKYFGPRINASMTIANVVNGQSGTLASAMLGAFIPVITSAAGAHDYEGMRNHVYRVCKIGVFLLLIFMIPLGLELKEVLRLWLGNPPPFVTGLCLCMMVILLIDKATMGFAVAINAVGKIAAFQCSMGIALMMTLPVAWIMLAFGGGVYCIGYALVLLMVVCGIGRVIFASKIVYISIGHWIRKVALPECGLIVMCLAGGYVPHFFMEASIFRIAVTTVICNVILFPIAWYYVLSCAERQFVHEKVKAWAESASKCFLSLK